MPTLKTVLQKLLPVISKALFYALYYLTSSLQFDVHIKSAAVPFDYLLKLLVVYILFALSWRLWVFVVLQGLLMGVLNVGNAMKISFFEGPNRDLALSAAAKLLGNAAHIPRCFSAETIIAFE